MEEIICARSCAKLAHFGHIKTRSLYVNPSINELSVTVKICGQLQINMNKEELSCVVDVLHVLVIVCMSECLFAEN